MNTGMNMTGGVKTTTHDIDIELPPLPAWQEVDNKHKDGKQLTALEQLILFEGYESDFHEHLRPALLQVVSAAIEADRKRRGEPVCTCKTNALGVVHRTDGPCFHYDPQPAEPVQCPTCGTHEVSLERTCHNSTCSAYGVAATVYEGWKTPPADPVKVPSDAESWLEEAIDEVVVAALEEGMCGKAMGDTPLTDSAKAGAMQRIRALLARYGRPRTPEKLPTNAQIREVFLANGFTIKPGHDDLKPYVYEAARELLRRYGDSEWEDFPK